MRILDRLFMGLFPGIPGTDEFKIVLDNQVGFYKELFFKHGMFHDF